MKRIYDITMPITEGMQVYKNKEEKKPKFEITSNFDTGSVRETKVHLDVHTGTHVDAHLHMLPNGSTIEAIAIERLIRPSRVIDLTHVKGQISAADLEDKSIQADEFLLFKTQNSFEDTFNFEFVFVAEDAARFLASKGIAGVGVDGLGVERGQSGHPTHKALFEKDIIVIEGLRLGEVPPGQYLMVAAPLRLVGLDAAPARVVLIEE